MGYSDPTLKKLFALSGNNCAYPGCPAPIVDGDSGIIVGEICHIKGKSPNGPRYDETQSDEERNGYDNLLVMCDPHNKIVDHKDTRDEYPPKRLRQFKDDHEAKYRLFLTDDEFASLSSMESDGGPLIYRLKDQYMMNRFVNHFHDVQGSVIATHNQSGGQTAHQITNIVHAPQASAPTLPSLVLIVESLMTKGDNGMRVDLYDLRIKLRNDGPSTVKTYRVEIEIPWHHFTSNSTYPAEVKNHTRGKVRVFRFTEQGHPGFTLYPGDTSDYLILLDYSVSFEQYRTITTESIKVLLYSGDVLLSSRNYPLTNYLDETRLDQILGM